jgi:hypothetical protein
VRASLAGKLRRLEARVAEQLDSIREDTKQVRGVAAGCSRGSSGRRVFQSQCWKAVAVGTSAGVAWAAEP